MDSFVFGLGLLYNAFSVTRIDAQLSLNVELQLFS